MPGTGLIITKDVFFASKVTGTAAALGLMVRSISSLEQFETVVFPDTRLVILDLDCLGITPHEVITALPTESPVTTIAFGPHVQEDKLAAAKSAGFQQVLPRSKFSAGLVEILKMTLASTPQS